MSFAGCQINLIDLNFHLQKSLEIWIQIQLTKSNPKITRQWKCPASCQLGLKADIAMNMTVLKILQLVYIQLFFDFEKSKTVDITRANSIQVWD